MDIIYCIYNSNMYINFWEYPKTFCLFWLDILRGLTSKHSYIFSICSLNIIVRLRLCYKPLKSEIMLLKE